MKTTLLILGGVFSLFGILWILQGTNVLAGSTMSGQSFWTTVGVVVLIVGVVLEVIGLSLKKKQT